MSPNEFVRFAKQLRHTGATCVRATTEGGSYEVTFAAEARAPHVVLVPGSDRPIAPTRTHTRADEAPLEGQSRAAWRKEMIEKVNHG